MADGDNVIKVNIEDQMRNAYIDYSMSVIVSRALPDVRDGLKPAHRRILFGMGELGVNMGKPHKKSARIVGEVLGKYHPHGDASVYMTMVRMAQDWSLRYPLIDGQGNFGSVDGDSPAAMRYTEARLSPIAEETLKDLDKNTVDFQLNFDDSLQEPTVLPTVLPNLLVNGITGIAVGMATSMAPHNLTDITKAIHAYIDNNDISIEELISIVKAPDFPTGGIIYGLEGVTEAFRTGRGRVVLRGKAEIETTSSGGEKIIVNEIPYLVNKSELIKHVADLINEKKIEGLSNVNDESDREGMRIVFDVKRDAMASVELNKLYKLTSLQSTFSVNNVALVKGRPKQLNLKELIGCFVEHRHDVITRRTEFELQQAEKRAHILEGLIIASDNIDEVIKIIRAAASPDKAREELIAAFNLSEEQSRAIVEMRLRQLTGLEQDKLRSEFEEVRELIESLKNVLSNVELRMQIVKDELTVLAEKYGDERRTEIQLNAEEFNPEDFFADDPMVITITHLGYIKRTPLVDYRAQGRGGIGAKGSSAREEDFLEHLLTATMHNTLLLFTKKGRCFWQKVYQLPEGGKNSKGRAIQNLIAIEPDDKVLAYINVETLKDKDYINSHYIAMCTRNGIIKKTSLVAYSNARQKGVRAITIRDNDELLEAKLTNGSQDLLLAVRSGKAIRFNESTIRAAGRTASGVIGIRMKDTEDQVVGMVCVENENEDILVVSENGYGKRSKLGDYRVINRGGQGIKTLKITQKTGNLVTIKNVTEEHDLMIITQKGIAIRTPIEAIRVAGRSTQGVRLISLRNDAIASVGRVPSQEEDEDITKEDSTENSSENSQG